MITIRSLTSALLCISGLACIAGCGDSGVVGTGDGCNIPEEQVFEPGATCEAFCQTGFLECDVIIAPDSAVCVQGCERNLACTTERSQACGDATDVMFQCAADLDCEGYTAWAFAIARWPDPPAEYPCQAETEAAAAACEGEQVTP